MLPLVSASAAPPATLSERLVGQCLVLLTVACTSLGGAAVAVADADVVKHSCSDVARYYQVTNGLEGERLRKKLFKITRNHHVLPYKQQTQKGPKHLPLSLKFIVNDPSPKTWQENYMGGLVRAIYSRVLELDRATSGLCFFCLFVLTGEHLWPCSYGLRRGLPEYNDLHNLRPADANVNFARGKKYFGECNPINDRTCLAPAFEEAAVDTATNKKIWMPPLKVRGDIARSLMYMVVRYGSDEHGKGFHLQLSDTPNQDRARMGVLSVLLRWNMEDPPSNEERLRNGRVCTMFQHNRNPFVDHPEFALKIWGASHSGQGR